MTKKEQELMTKPLTHMTGKELDQFFKLLDKILKEQQEKEKQNEDDK